MPQDNRKFFKVGTDVLEGTSPENIRKLELPEFKSLGLNIDLLGQGVSKGRTLSEMGIKTPAPSVPAGVSYDPKTGLSTIQQPPKVKEQPIPPVVTPTPPPTLPPELSVDQKSPVGGSDRIQAENKDTQTNIQKELARIGITQPEDKINPVVDQILTSLKQRQADLDKRQAEDIASITKGFEAAGEEQKITQEETLARAEGRTRIGGFITQMEVKDIQDLQRKFRLENVALEGQKAAALSAAQRSFDDNNFEVAKQQLDLARDIEKNTEAKKQSYFDNILKMQAYYERLNKPLVQAAEADQEYALSLLEADPTIAQRLNIKPSDIFLSKINMGSIITSYLDGPAYAQQQALVQQKIRGDLISEKPLTQPQLIAKGYADRTIEAHNIISSIGDKFTGLWSYISQYAPNVFKSSDRQRYEQAQRNFINAVLRRESGAAIAESEFSSAAKQYFPQPGDSAEVIEQKRMNRETTIQGIQGQAGQVSPITDTSNLRTKYNY